ncbi:iron-containing alcohol dehydrogenase [Haloplanus halobius]|uniref:iron-containing alcohol dehydrogenase n=1 Tax=Haloplanus halobius TaxID=2934938 RepID=UPI00200EFAAB|nr:iron-containing alcohol dehydrogenase [Haloplanus sp. XH21]
MSAPGSLADTHTVRSPGHVEYGTGAVAALESFATDHAADTALLVTDDHLSSSGVIDAPRARLEAAGLDVAVYDGVVPEPKLSMVESAAARIRDAGDVLVVGVGGGSSMDTAKLAATAATADESPRELLGRDNVSGRSVPLALVPTTAGTGSEVTDVGVFADDRDGGAKKVAFSPHLFADLAAVDPDLTKTMPPSVAAATGLDALTHAVESYVSLDRTPYTDTLARRAVELVAENLRPAVAQGEHNDAARARMSLAATLAGQAFINSGLGAVHALTYPLGMECDLGHGLANGVLLPHVMAYNVPAEIERFAGVASLLGAERRPGESTRAFASRSVDAVFDLLSDVDVPTSIAAYGEFDRATFERFADIAFEHSAHNIAANPRRMDRGDVVSVFESAAAGR